MCHTCETSVNTFSLQRGSNFESRIVNTNSRRVSEEIYAPHFLLYIRIAFIKDISEKVSIPTRDSEIIPSGRSSIGPKLMVVWSRTTLGLWHETIQNQTTFRKSFQLNKDGPLPTMQSER